MVVLLICSPYLETALSFSGSNITIASAVEEAHHKEMRVLSLTDWKMHGAYKFHEACKKSGIAPIIGLQVEFAPFYKDLPLHLILYAKNEHGYKNLLKLSGNNEPLDASSLKEQSEGITVVLNGCTGEAKALYDEGSVQALRSLFQEMKSLFPDIFLGVPEEYDVPFPIKRLPLDRVMYLKEEDGEVFSILRRIFQRTPLASFPKERKSFKSERELAGLLSKEGKETLETFCKKHALDLSFPKPALPGFRTPEGITSGRFLRALAQKGLDKRLKGRRLDRGVYDERLAKELGTIHEMGYDDYFLIVWDVVRYAKGRGILVGPGRGSAPGSLVAYALGITTVDPLEHGLLFERFLNKARRSMPDIDIDFPDQSRDEVLRYVRDTYGEDNAALICTFGTFLSKSSLRDTARVLEIESRYVTEMTRKVGRFGSIKKMLSEDEDVKNRMNDPRLKHWLLTAARIEGLPRHVSTHAAGVILSEKPLISYTPLQEGLAGLKETQYEQSDLEAMGLLKIDFLGLRNLSMIEEVCARVEKYETRTIYPYRLPTDDEKTFRFLREGSTTGIFQLESRGMRRLIRQMRIKEFADIPVVLALYRPGPMESIPLYLKRRFKRAEKESVAKDVDPILAPTEGILLYQEQIMAIAHDFAGYTLDEADILRRAVSKKERTILEKERKNFVQKAKRAGRDVRLADRIYDYIVKFADYGFNKSHSVAYGLISYWMAYLKANHPAHFLSVLMQSALTNEDKMRLYMREALEHDLHVMGPDVNESGYEFSLSGNRLYYPLHGVKTISRDKAVAFVELRAKITLRTFVDFIVKTRNIFNRRQVEYLIHAGALDSFGLSKKTMAKNLDAVMEAADYGDTIDWDQFVLTDAGEYDHETLRQNEREALGLNLAYDALRPYEALIRKKGLRLPSEVEDVPLKKEVGVIGILREKREITTKKGDRMAFLEIDDGNSSMNAVCFPETYRRFQEVLEEGKVLWFQGRVTLREGKRQFELTSANAAET